jgi:hypothetical protein
MLMARPIAHGVLSFGPLELHDAQIEEIDIEGILGFAEPKSAFSLGRDLFRPFRIWNHRNQSVFQMVSNCSGEE